MYQEHTDLTTSAADQIALMPTDEAGHSVEPHTQREGHPWIYLLASVLLLLRMMPYFSSHYSLTI